MVKFAKAYAIKNGPVCLEMRTYRYHGHSMSDPGVTYRQKAEIDEYRKSKDPIQLMRNMILEHKVLSEDDIKVRSLIMLKLISSFKLANR